MKSDETKLKETQNGDIYLDRFFVCLYITHVLA